MKITREHYVTLRCYIKDIWTADAHEAKRQAIIAEGRARDTEKRLRWDWLWQANASPFVIRVLYQYLDDSHIDTALKRIMKELEDAQ